MMKSLSGDFRPSESYTSSSCQEWRIEHISTSWYYILLCLRYKVIIIYLNILSRMINIRTNIMDLRLKLLLYVILIRTIFIDHLSIRCLLCCDRWHWLCLLINYMSWIILEEINFLCIKNRSIIKFCLLDSLCLLIYDMSWIILHIHYFIIQVCSCWSLECV